MLRKFFHAFSQLTNDARHGAYVWWLTGSCLMGMMLIAMTRIGTVAEHAVDSLSSVLITVVCTYLGVEVVGRSQVLNKLGERLSPTSATDPASNVINQEQETGHG